MTPDLATLCGPCGDAPAALPCELLPVLSALVPALLRRDGDMLTVKDASDGAYVYAGAAMLAWLDRGFTDVSGRRDVDLFEPGVASAFRAAEQSALTQAQALVSEHRFEWRGTRQEFSVLRQRLDGSNGRTLLAAVWRDMAPQRQREALHAAAIAQLEQAQRAVEQLRREVHDPTLRDGQTGLYNRAHFDDQLRREVDLSTREHREFALVAIELDTLSPEAAVLGDAARLRIFEALGRLLRGNTRAMDASCRFDEARFGVLLSGVGLATAQEYVLGARLTGAGFGGCTVNLIRADRVQDFARDVIAPYRARTALPAVMYVTSACDGLRTWRL